MSSMFMSTISALNVIKEKINSTTQKINKNIKKNQELIVVENTVSESNLSTGVKTKQVYDDYNDFIIDEIRKTKSKVTEEQVAIEQLLELSDVLCSKSNLFSNLINEFYHQIQDDTILGNKYIISEKMQRKLHNIVISFKDFDRRLEFLELRIKRMIEKKIDATNTLLDNITKINYLLKNTYTDHQNSEYTKLINEREQIVDELNNLIGIKVIKENGNYKINLNNGMCILENDNKKYLVNMKSTNDPKYISIGYSENEFSNNIKNIEDLFQTGSLGALLKFRREELNNARNTVGQLALNFVDSINNVHTLGFDQYGQVGEQIFNFSQPQVIHNPENKSHVSIYTKWESGNLSQSSDYRLCFKNNQWIVTRVQDNTIIIPKSIRKKNNITYLYFNIDGIDFNIRGNPNEGDNYIVKPYAQILQTLELMVDENTQFAISFTEDPDKRNKNNAIAIHQLYKDKIVNNKYTLNEAYQNFSKDIVYKYRIIEDGLPFKEKIVGILHDKQSLMLNNVNQEYQNLTYEQKCYAANVKILKIAEKILNDIISAYS